MLPNKGYLDSSCNLFLKVCSSVRSPHWPKIAIIRGIQNHYPVLDDASWGNLARRFSRGVAWLASILNELLFNTYRRYVVGRDCTRISGLSVEPGGSGP